MPLCKKKVHAWCFPLHEPIEGISKNQTGTQEPGIYYLCLPQRGLHFLICDSITPQTLPTFEFLLFLCGERTGHYPLLSPTHTVLKLPLTYTPPRFMSTGFRWRFSCTSRCPLSSFIHLTNDYWDLLGCEALKEIWKYRQTSEILAGPVPDHHHKESIVIKGITHIFFWFLSAYRSYVYTVP